MYHQWPENPKTSPVPIKRDQPRERDEQKSVGKDRRDEKGAGAHVREKEVARTIFREDLSLPDVCVCMSVNSNS